MKKLPWLLFVCLPLSGFCQLTGVDLYQYNYTTISPAFAGLDSAKITAMESLMVPKDDVPRALTPMHRSLFLGYETPLKIRKMDYGAAISFINTYSGPYSAFIHANASFNSQIKIRETQKLVFGVRLGYEYAEPLERPVEDFADIYYNPHASAFSGALAALYKTKRFYGGFSVDNLFSSKKFREDTGVDPRYNIIVGLDLGGPKLASNHSVYVTWMNHSNMIAFNNSVVIRDRVIVGFSYAQADDDNLVSFNAGLKFRRVGRAVVTLYSSSNDIDYKKFSSQLMLQFYLKRRAKTA